MKEGQSILNMLLKSELLGVEYLSQRQHEGQTDTGAAVGAGAEPAAAAAGGTCRGNFQNLANPNLFKFKVGVD